MKPQRAKDIKYFSAQLAGNLSEGGRGKFVRVSPRLNSTVNHAWATGHSARMPRSVPYIARAGK